MIDSKWRALQDSEPLAASRLRFGVNFEASAPKATARRGASRGRHGVAIPTEGWYEATVFVEDSEPLARSDSEARRFPRTAGRGHSNRRLV